MIHYTYILISRTNIKKTMQNRILKNNLGNRTVRQEKEKRNENQKKKF